jgi:hypothetical protein
VIILEFLIDENALQEDLSANPSIEDLAVLQETFFVFPTRLSINRSEMFDLSNKRLVMYGGQTSGEIDITDQVIEKYWLPLPLLHFVLIGSGQIRRACEGEETSYALPGTGAKLVFKPVQDKIEVHSTLNGKVEWVECQELIGAINSFRSKAFDFIKYKVPNMEQHPEWKKISSYFILH